MSATACHHCSSNGVAAAAGSEPWLQGIEGGMTEPALDELDSELHSGVALINV
jgi:hypothetical protein